MTMLGFTPSAVRGIGADDGDFLGPPDPIQTLGSLVRKGVQVSNDALVQGTTNAKIEAYIMSKRAQGRSDDVFGRLPPPPNLEEAFARRTFLASLQAFSEETGLNPEDLCRKQLPQVEAKYRPYFPDLPVMPRDSGFLEGISDPALYSFKSYCAYKFFAERLATSQQVRKFSRRSGQLMLTCPELAGIKLQRCDARKEGIKKCLAECSRLLYELKDGKRFLTGFRINDDNLDSDSYTEGDGYTSCNFDVVLDQPAALAATVQLDYEGQKRLLPNTVPELLRAYLSSCNVSEIEYDLLYLDDRYRPASDYSPTQLLISWAVE